MITKLQVQNILLLDNLELDFKPGLNILTGETGAGKSILLDCLGYLLGKRNRRIEIGNSDNKALIVGEFNIEENNEVVQFLETHGIPNNEFLILRQSINYNNKRRVFINDLPCSIDLVRKLGDLLLDLNGQFEEQGLLNVQNHMKLLDDFGNLEQYRSSIEETWIEVGNQKKILEEEYKKTDLVENPDFLNRSINEIIELDLKENELNSIEERRNKLRKASKISSDLINSIQYLNQETVEESLLNTVRSLERLEKKVDNELKLPVELLNSALDNFSRACDILGQLSQTSEKIENELIQIEERYHAIKRVCRTHKVELNQIANLKIMLENELDNISSVEENIKKTENKITFLEEKYKKEATFLSQERHKYASRLDKKVEKELKPLKLDLAKFKTELTPGKETKKGYDNVCFTTSINPGTDFKPLNKIASGGELSRFLLAVKLCFLGKNYNKSQIFDEIDRGVGGATASAIGKRLLQLSKHEQVLVVTHSPQVAAYSDNHLKVHKSTQGKSITTNVEVLDEEELVQEIARMLSGELISSEALAAAKSLRKFSKPAN